MIPIEGSSAITHYDYDPKTRRLTLQFTKGKQPTVIEDVDKYTFQDFLNAKSKGKFFHERLK